MDLKKIIQEQNLSDSPIGLGGCRLSENHFDSCGFDLMVFEVISFQSLIKEL